MIFNVPERLISRTHRIIVRKQLLLEKFFRDRIEHILSYQYRIIAVQVRQGIRTVDFLIDRTRGYMLKAISEQYTRIGLQFFFFVLDGFLQQDRKNSGVRAQNGMAEEFWRAFHSWTLLLTSKNVGNINNTTKKLIHRIIKEGINEGAAMPIIADRIEEYGRQINKHRAMRIARTEVHSASVYAIDTAVKSTRVQFNRVWTATIDERTRTDHRRANGQVRGLNEPFDVGGENLMFPGDPNGSAGNIINCRCAILYRNDTLRRYFE